MTQANEQSSIIESPWLWILLFSVFGLALLYLFSPKYHDLQTLKERHYQAQERRVEKLTAKNNPQGSQRIEDSEARRPFATPGNNLIKLWPLTTLMGLVAIVAAAMLYRASRTAGTAQTEVGSANSNHP